MSARHRFASDVLLNDGAIATIRPVVDSDATALTEFYSRVSEHSKYLRFFANHPELTESDLAAFLDSDGHDKVTLVLEDKREDTRYNEGRIVAIAGYKIVPEYLPTRVGDVSFLVQDDQQGRGVGNILLEHLADIGREQGVERFTAEMLTQNRQMTRVFLNAGYSAQPELADGYITVDFPIAPSRSSQSAMMRREQRAEANSLRRVLSPKTTVALRPENGNVLEQLGAIEGDVDLVIADHKHVDFDQLVAAAHSKNATTILLPVDAAHRAMTDDIARKMVRAVRDAGMRMIGPASIGLVNTHPEVNLNLTPAFHPRRGHVGMFTQTAGVGTLVLSRAIERGCGISTFVSAGIFSDVTANDVMQFWASDEDTQVCLLSLDSIGNPRKFFRVLRALSQLKHVVVFMPSRALHTARHYHQDGLVSASPQALDQVVRRAGAVVVSRRDAMYDVAQILARQPLPRGPKVAVLSNSDGIAQHMLESARRFGLVPTVYSVPDGEPLEALTQRIDEILASANATTDALVVTVAELGDGLLEKAHVMLARRARSTTIPLIATYVGFNRPPFETVGAETHGQLPVCDTYAEALESLGLIVDTQRQRAEIAAAEEPTETSASALREARATIENVLRSSPQGRWATPAECSAILAAYGIALVPSTGAGSLAEATREAEQLGWDVVLKCVGPMVRARNELPIIFRHINDRDALASAWSQILDMAHGLGVDDLTLLEPVVQKTVQPGTTLTIRAIEDPTIGPITSVGIAGVSSEVLGDLAWRTPPLTRADARSMLLELDAAPLLAGYRGAPATALSPIEDVVLAVSQLNDDNPALVDIELTPVIAGVDSTTVVGARMRIAPLKAQRDPLARSI
ncbi:GNAT family N-acetyltransferase [Corynebacterium lubricantis]|uniref:GNAT family N-acetyltransferase n=1 Tax=Corynebacterium lubricantis TaxID=541095 RepID=UPI00036EED9C|nr:GNAT family N-acetyltransferase [Corynebacterium lubricantis]